jgi:hypothetical protein
MIVWGGYNKNGWTNGGGRYNLSTNSWKPTSLAGCPIPRGYHVGVWTGSRMLIWGGWNGAIGNFDTGSIYNPANDSWKDMTKVAAPSARRFETGVWSGTQLIVWGGYDGSNYVKTGGRYIP